MSSIRITCDGESENIEITGDSTLLGLLRSAGYSLPAACGGRGRCGKCRVLINGVSRLACKAVPHNGDEITLTKSSGGKIATDAKKFFLPKAHDETGIAAAVDLGTTTVAVRLYDLAVSREIATCGAWNRQAAYGGDVISRIDYAIENADHARELSNVIRGQVEDMISEELRAAGKTPGDLKRTVLCGNTVMEHLFANLPVSVLAHAPFAPETLFWEDFSDTLLSAPLYYAPCVAGYVGGDIVAGLLASGIYKTPETVLFLDIGTNGEIVLACGGELLCCAVASGPAFEGAGISHGMAALDGAVSHAVYEHGFLYDIIGGVQMRGICGSGLCDLIAVLTEHGVISRGGRLLPHDAVPDEMRRYVTDDANGNGIFHLAGDITLTAQDVRAFQLAKGAIAGGVSVLLSQSSAAAQTPDIYLAGGFGSFLSPKSACAVGMLPPGAKKIESLGNTALAGAAAMALNPEMLAISLRIAKKCRYIELSGRTDFAEAFAHGMLL